MADYNLEKNQKLSITTGRLTEGISVTGEKAYQTGYSEGVSETQQGTAVASQVLSTATFTNSIAVAQSGTMVNSGSFPAVVGANQEYTHGVNAYVENLTVVGPTLDGNAVGSQVLSGSTYYSDSDTKQTGTMPNKGDITFVAGVDDDYDREIKGYVNSISVVGPKLTGTAVASQVLSDQTFYNNDGTKKTGTMKNFGSAVVTVDANDDWSHDYNAYVETLSFVGPTLDGNVVGSQVLSGSTYYKDSSTKQTGTMANRGTVTTTIAPGASYTIQSGFHTGSGTVSATANTGTATASQVLTGQTFYGNSATKQTGSMANNGAVAVSQAVSSGAYTIPSGFHNGSGKVLPYVSDGNAIASQVLSSQTFRSNSAGSVTLATGSMPNRGAVSSTLLPNSSYTIPDGYHNGSGVITASPMTETAVLSTLTSNASLSNGDLADMGIANIYRYVNALGFTNGIKVAHTVTYDDGFNKINTQYGNNVAWTRVLTIPGASNLVVIYHWQTESTSYDWGCIWEGSHPDYTANSNYSSCITGGKIGGTTASNATATIAGNTVTVGFRSDTSQCTYDGFYVLVMDKVLYDYLTTIIKPTLSGNAQASQVLSGSTFYNTSADTIVTGTMANNGAITTTTTYGGTYTIPSGFHNGSGVVTGGAFSFAGNVTASQILSGQTGYGNSSTRLTGTMANRGTVTTTTTYGGSYSIQSGFYSGGTITGGTFGFSGNVTASQILSGRTGYGANSTKITGTMANRGAITCTITTNGGTVTIASGFHSGTGTVKASITVSNPTLSGNATASQVLSGSTFYSNTYTRISGTMVNRGAKNVILTAAAPSTAVTVGYYTGGTVSVAVGTATLS